jgi:hypothetical protein
MPVNLNLWTTVSVLNIDDLINIQSFARDHGIDHDYAYLKQPDPLAVENRNSPESLSYIRRQKQLRGLE